MLADLDKPISVSTLLLHDTQKMNCFTAFQDYLFQKYKIDAQPDGNDKSALSHSTTLTKLDIVKLVLLQYSL